MLKNIPGLRAVNIERTKASGSKTARFLEMQPYISKQLISLPADAKHTQMCLTHMSKITANNTHRFDDIADTAYDAVKMGLIDKVVRNSQIQSTNYSEIGKMFNNYNNKIDNLRSKAYQR
jgi:phage terminase large subunit-like protein